MTEMTTAALTTPTAQPTPRGRRLPRLSAVLISVLASMVALTGTAAPVNAAHYYDNQLRTASGARAWASALCGGRRGELRYGFGLSWQISPDYWRFAQRRVGGSWSSWFGWYSTSDRSGSLDITISGDWQFKVQIAYWNGAAWEYDSEFALHRNMEWVGSGWDYVTGRSCHIA